MNDVTKKELLARIVELEDQVTGLEAGLINAEDRIDFIQQMIGEMHDPYNHGYVKQKTLGAYDPSAKPKTVININNY